MDRIIDVKVFGSHLIKDSDYAGVKGESNVTKLRITFDESWDGLAKDIIFWDAYGMNPTRVIMTAAFLEDATKSVRIYLVPIFAEPLAHAGEITFSIIGSEYNKTQKSIEGKLKVKDSPTVLEPAIPPTPDQYEQFRVQVEELTAGVAEAAQAKEDILKMTVTSETLPAGAEATAQKSENNGVVNLHFGIPEGKNGEKGVGIEHIKYAPSEDGNGTTVSVYLTGGKIEQFLIPNGKNGIAVKDARYTYGEDGTTYIYFALDDGNYTETSVPIPPAQDGVGIDDVISSDSGTHTVVEFVKTDGSKTKSVSIPNGIAGKSGLPDRVVCHNGSFDGGVSMILNPDLYNNHHYEFTFDEDNTAGSITAKIKLYEDDYDTPSDTSKSSAITVRYDSVEGVSLVLCDGNYDSSVIVWSGAEPTFTPGYTYFLSFVPLSDTRILGAWSEVPTV